MRPEPVPDEAALIAGSSLIVADLHIGIEAEFRQRGFHIPDLTGGLAMRLMRLADAARARRLVILGDLKHGITGQRADLGELRWFLSELAEHLPVHIIKGNHDGAIQYLARGIEGMTVHGPRGYKLGTIGLFHGHAHPSEELMGSRTLVTAHEHPVVRLTDRLGTPVHMKVWLKVPLERGIGPKELIVMPAFNDFLGGTAVNSAETRFLGPFLRKKGALKLEDSEIYLLDGTYLGMRKDLI